MRAPDPPDAARLRSMALGVLGDPPLPPDARARRRWAETLTDESGARPAALVPLLYDLAGADAAGQRAAPEAPFWCALSDTDADPLALPSQTEGPLLARSSDAALETWSESELSALHALGALAAARDSPQVWDRLWSAADWHARELQPDNATARPWAAHVFLLRACRAEDPALAAAASLHASTLIHNCMVARGRPDRLSACVLLHSSLILERLDPSRDEARA